MNVFVLLGPGAAAGLLAGMFGVGGGFLATPLLIFVGIPPAVAVASQANQVVANSVSSLQVQLRRGNVDLRMGLILLLGGLFGSTAGVWLFTYLKRIGQVDFVIAVAYVVMLSTIGVLMLVESLRTYVRRRRNPQAPRGKLHTHYLVHRLPLKLRFYKSKLYISALLPIGIGFVIGVLSAILGVGGGFVLVPAMIYILGMPTAVVIGTSNFQILFVAANVTFLQAATNGTVDIVLALLLILGGVVGAPVGSRLAAKLPGVVLRGLMSILILAVATELLTELLRTPSSLYSLGTREVMECRGPEPACGASVGRRLYRADHRRTGRFHRAALGARRGANARSGCRSVACPRVDHLGVPGREHPAVRHVRPAGRDRRGRGRAGRSRDGAAQAAFPRPVAQHRPPGLRRRARLLRHRRQPAPTAPARARRRRRDPVAGGSAVERALVWPARAPGSHQIPPGSGRGKAARRSLSRRHRAGHHPGRPAVPCRSAVPLPPAGGRLRGADVPFARRQDRRGGVTTAAGGQGGVQRPACRLGGQRGPALRLWRGPFWGHRLRAPRGP